VKNSNVERCVRMTGRSFDKVNLQIAAFIDRIKEKYFISEVILFGSRARDEYLLSSDVDLIIVSPDFEGVYFLNRIVMMLELWEGEVPLEPLCYTPSEFSSMKNQLTIVNVACSEGIELLSQEST
jgi:hypothetical protein